MTAASVTLHFAAAVAGVGQRLFKRAERELLGEEHQEFHTVLLAATYLRWS